MSTIRLLRGDEVSGPGSELVQHIRQREKRVFGIDDLSNIWRSMAHHHPYMQANWQRSRATMQRGEVPPLIKEMVASTVSMINACHY
jgi:hypothetical protein